MLTLWSDWDRLFDFDSLMRDNFATVRTRKNEDGIGYEFDMPGINAENINIEAKNGVLTVRGETEDRRYHNVLTLPRGIDADAAEADYENGVLRIAFGWSEAAKPKRIEVSSSKTKELTG